MADSAESTTRELAELRKLFAERIQNDTAKERAFDELYEELKQYKDDFLFQAEKPLLLDLLLFFDSMNLFQEGLKKGDMSPDVLADTYQYLIDEFLELLYRRDVLPIESTDTFDRKLHKAVKVEDTDDESQDYKVLQILKRGFVRSERLLRAEEVVIHRLRKK